MEPSSPLDPAVLAAVQLALSGESEAARQQLGELWQTLPASDGFHRCIVAHYLADLQPEARDELSWDQAALNAALSSKAEAFEGKIPGVNFESFLPSLYLNLASSFERVLDLDAAKQHALMARRVSQSVAEGPLAELTHSAIQRICVRLGVALE